MDYEILPGWKTDISGFKNYSDLPKAAQQYVERIEELVGVPIHYIGVGPGREALIYKWSWFFALEAPRVVHVLRGEMGRLLLEEFIPLNDGELVLDKKKWSLLIPSV